jgi:hypothetical protein
MGADASENSVNMMCFREISSGRRGAYAQGTGGRARDRISHEESDPRRHSDTVARFSQSVMMSRGATAPPGYWRRSARPRRQTPVVETKCRPGLAMPAISARSRDRMAARCRVRQRPPTEAWGATPAAAQADDNLARKRRPEGQCRLKRHVPPMERRPGSTAGMKSQAAVVPLLRQSP